jgi:isoleucyl-tRNA synthetase
MWPKYAKADKKLISEMEIARKFVTSALEQRAKANIKVRQPLRSVKLKAVNLTEGTMFLIKDEVNVKEIITDATLSTDVVLDTVVSDDLRREGVIRDLIRAIQDLRKTEGLTVGDKAMLLLDSDEKGKELVQEFLGDIKKVTLVTGVEYTTLAKAAPLAIEGYSFKIGIKR